MAYDQTIFNINPYYDDFDSDKGFLRVLFKPGYAVQARELTQLQTILQSQISKIGDHLFKDGSRIVGGGITVRNANYLMLDVSAPPLLSVTDYERFVGGYLVGADGVFRAKVIHYIAPDAASDQKLILVYDIISGSSVAPVFSFVKDEQTVYPTLSVPNASYPTTGVCKAVVVDEGIFYVDGFFARNPLLTFSPYRVITGTTPYRDLSFGTEYSLLSKKIGFSITRDAVTEQEDSTLRDPAIGSYNYNAPGADRYKIVFELDQSDLGTTPQDFIELIRIESGRVTRKVERITYGEIQNVLARRTYDESGSYVVYPFDPTVRRNSTNTTKFDLQMGPGKAYVFGYELETRYPQTIGITRAHTTSNPNHVKSETNSQNFIVGNYIGVSLGNASQFGQTYANNLVTIASGSALAIFRSGTALSSPGSVVATGYVHGLVPYIPSGSGSTGSFARMYLYGVSGSISSAGCGFIFGHTSGTSTTSGRTLAAFTSTLGGLTFENIVGVENQSLVFPILPGYAINDVSQLTMYGKLVSNQFVPTQSGTVTTYEVTKSSLTQSIPNAASASSVTFIDYGTGTPTGQGVLDQVEIVSLDATRAGLGFTPIAAVGTTLSNGGSPGSTVRLQVNNAPIGFTAGAANTNVRMILPVKYTPTLTENPPVSFRYKTSVTTTTTAIAVSTAKTQDESGRYYFQLPFPDVHSVSAVTVTPAGTNITDDFELDDGQRESHYQNSRLYIKKTAEGLARYTSSPVSFTVSYSYYQHLGLTAGPFIGKKSYPGITYENIPLFTNPRTGKTVSLANCLDFRRTGITSESAMLKPYGGYEFASATEAQTALSYTHFLPRIDKLCVKPDPADGSAMFFLVEGVPDLAPMAPPDPVDALVLATITVPAYTHNPEDLVFTPANNQRYTMADIGKLEKRIDDVEVFAKLSLSEAEIEARTLKTTSSANEPLKTSIFSDEFYGHSSSDVSASDHVCSVDFERGELRPFFSYSPVSYTNTGVVRTTSNTFVTIDGVAGLTYTGADYISNLQFTKRVKPNPSNTVNWLGTLKLSQQVFPFFDVGYRPVIKTNSLLENDNWIGSNAGNARGFGTQWNDWESIWTGIEEVEEEQDDIQKQILEAPRVDSQSMIPSINSGNVRSGVNRGVLSVNQKNSNYIRSRQLRNRIRRKVGSRIVDNSVVPYLPTATVGVTAFGLKPNMTSTSGLALYVDGILVKTGLITDANGTCETSFTIPAGSFLAGTKSVRMSDSSTVENCTVSAEENIYCVGALQQQDSGSYSTRPPTLRRRTVNSETISKDPFNKSQDSLENSNPTEPLSQTFFVDKVVNPEGIFLNSVSLYFYSKDTVLPLMIDVRPTVSGYPSPSVVLPFSTVVKQPSQINVSRTQPTETVFSFSTPVYLPPGEYAICITTNSSEYELFAADASANSADQSGRAGNNQLVGTLFAPQGSSTLVQENSTDLMFKVSRCSFTPSTGTLLYTGLPNCQNRQVIKLYAPETIPTDCSVSRLLQASVGGSVPFGNNESVYLNTVLGSDPNVTYTLSRGVANTVSPMIDVQAQFGASVQMYAGLGSSYYVSRAVELPENIASDGIAVFVDANVPSGSSVRAYYRVSSVGETDIFTKTWQPLILTSPSFTSSSEIDFREMVFRTTSALPQRFKSYQIRLELSSTPTIPTYYQTPAVRSVRTVSFINP